MERTPDTAGIGELIVLADVLRRRYALTGGTPDPALDPDLWYAETELLAA